MRAETAGEKGEGVALFDEHQLAREEEMERHVLRVALDEAGRDLLERELDIPPDALRASGALVPRLHDALARAGDYHETIGGDQLGELARERIIRIGLWGAGGAEDADFSHRAIRREES